MKKGKTLVTIRDVAKRAGVSTTTISRYLNGKFEFMSAESQQRIKEVIEELNFRPNHLARSLKLSKSRLIGVLIADISNPFSSILLKGITDYCKQCGYNVVIANTDNDCEKEREYILSMLDQRVEGLIVNITGDNNEFLGNVSENIPVVLADRPVFPTMFDTVKTNDYQSTIDAIQYLAAEGFTRVGFFTEPIHNIGTRITRQRAYRQACTELLHIEPQEFVINSQDEDEVQNLVQKFLDNNRGQINTIFTANGVTMLSVLRAIHRLGLSIPRDIGICGFDDLPWMELIGPGITVVSQPFYHVGMECARRIMFRLEESTKASPEVIELPNQLIIRGSTKINK